MTRKLLLVLSSSNCSEGIDVYNDETRILLASATNRCISAVGVDFSCFGELKPL